MALPPEREQNINKREGFTYWLVTVNFVKGMKFGLGIKHYMNMVLVSKVDEGSMVGEVLKVGDHIIDINGTPVTDKDVCKTLLVKSLQQTQSVSMLVARPAETQAKEVVESALQASLMQPPSVAVAPDVRSIMKRFDQKLRTPQEAPKAILIGGVAPSGNIKISEETPMSARITNDYDGYQLQKVPKKMKR